MSKDPWLRETGCDTWPKVYLGRHVLHRQDGQCRIVRSDQPNVWSIPGCYAYLSEIDGFQSRDKVVCSRWFSRWRRLDNRTNLAPSISRVTRIPRRVLMGNSSGDYSVAQIMSWAAEQTVSRDEDMTYCLLGLLGINMPLIYGERTRASQRLQQERPCTLNLLWRASLGKINQEAAIRICVDFAGLRSHGFGLVQRTTPDDDDENGGAEVRWGFAESDLGSLHLDIDFSGLYAGLRFEDPVSHEGFVLMLGSHNYQSRADVRNRKDL